MIDDGIGDAVGGLNESDRVEAVDRTQVVLRGTNLSALMAQSAATVAKISALIDKALENPRVQGDLDLLLRVHRQTSTYQIDMMTAATALMEATKGKDGRIQKLTDSVIGDAETAVMSSVGGQSVPKGKGRLGALG